MTDDYMQPAGAFLDWFRAWPGTTFHEDIEIVDLRARGAGRGIVAKKDIPVDTVLFTIPRAALLSEVTSDLAKRIPLLKGKDEDKNGENDDDDDDDDSKASSPWTALILVLVYEFLRGPSSPWKPYLDVLPATFDTPMFWAADELAALQASPVVGRVGRAEADAMIRTKVLPVIRAHGAVFFGEAGGAEWTDERLLELAHRMGSTIMAYSFSLEKEDDDDDEEDDNEAKQKEDTDMKDGSESESASGSDNDGWVEDRDEPLPLGMVPMADMLNADAEFNAHIHHGADALSATAVRPIRAGDEILNYYGPLSNGELLRRYGYVTAAHAHFDAVDLPWRGVQAALATELGVDAEVVAKIAKHLREADDDDDDGDDDDNDWDDPIMLDRAFEADPETGRLSAPADGRLLPALPPVLRRRGRAFVRLARRQKATTATRTDKEIVAAAILRAVDDRIAAYPTTLAEDEAVLAGLAADAGDNAADAANPSPARRRYGAALTVRVGEKRLLAEARARAAEAVEAAAAEAQARAAKDGKKKKSGSGGGGGGDGDNGASKRQKRR